MAKQQLLSVSLVGLAIGMGSIAVPSEFQPVSSASRQVREQPAEPAGILQGSVSIGPICPVERAGVPCEPNPEAYKSVNITLSGPGQFSKTFSPNADGMFQFDLAPGSYEVTVNHSYMSPQDYRQRVIIRPCKTTNLKIDLDTGIR